MHLLDDGPAEARKFFWLPEDCKTNWFFWEAYLSFTWCSNISQTKRRKLAAASLLLPCFDEYNYLFYCNEYFNCFGFKIEVFSYCTFTKSFAIGFRNWFDHKWLEFGVLCLIKDFFVDFMSVSSETCKKRSNLFLFWQHHVFPISSFRVFWSVL